MQKTPFAGLTVLDPEESLEVDGGSFQYRNPVITDQFLRVGAVAHRHDEHAPLGDPLAAPSAVTASAGGGLPAGSDYYIAYTAVDADGGETRPSPVTIISTPEAIEDPISGPSVTIDTGGGTIRAGTYSYAYTLIDEHGGETLLSDDAYIERPFGPASASVFIGGLAGAVASAGAAGWRLYKSGAAGVYHYLAEGTGDSVLDDGTLCADCSDRPPDINTTRQTNTLVVTVPEIPGADGFRLWLSNTGDFIGGFAGEYPMASAGVEIPFTQLVLGDGSPPDVSTSVPGARKLDPATELASGSARGWANVGIAGVTSYYAASSLAENSINELTITTEGPTLVRFYGRFEVDPGASAIDVVARLDGVDVTPVGHFVASGLVAIAGSAIADVTGLASAVMHPPLEVLITDDGPHTFELDAAGDGAAVGERRLILDPRALSEPL